MNIIEVVKKMNELLNNKTIHFDHKNFDYKSDIPHLIVNGERKYVYSIKFVNDNIEIVMSGKLFAHDENDFIVVVYDFKPDSNRTIEMINDECNNLEMYNLLMDTYYETPQSYEIGDFETRFLKLN